MNTEIEEKLKTLPDKSGIYIMRNSSGEIIYVGKAKNLKNRVRSYFKSHKHPPKVRSMVENVETFEYIITDNELEALVLENNLIKQNMPKYNILLKDDKTYPFLKVTVNEDFPRFVMSRKVEKDNALYFGPYQSSADVKQLISLVKEIYCLRSCSADIKDGMCTGRPCLYYQLGKCKGPCNGSITVSDYRELVDKAVSFINVGTDDALEELTMQMNKASKNFDFEKAALCRDRIKAIEALSEKQKIVNPKGSDSDAVALYNANNTACVQVFFIRSGKIVGREHYFFNDTDGIDAGEILFEFLRFYYENASFIPGVIYIEQEIDDIEVMEQWITSKAGRNVKLRIPKIGDKTKLIRMIKANAKKEHSERELKILRDIGFKNSVLSELHKTLNLKTMPVYIEAYDISNMGDNSSVASMVVYKNGKPCTKRYRNFKIKTVSGQDDYSSMHEVITRRMKRAQNEENAISEGKLSPEDAAFLPLPDVIFADGGAAHRKVVCSALGDVNIPVFGIVKDDNHRTRGLVGPEGEIFIDRKSDLFMFITNIQDEMHRRAIGYMRRLQQKKTSFSELDSIKGVGASRKAVLLKEFRSINSIKKATVEELSSVKGIDKTTAKTIFEYFNDNKE